MMPIIHRSPAIEISRLVDELFLTIDAGYIPSLEQMLAMAVVCVRYACYADANRILTWLGRFEG